MEKLVLFPLNSDTQVLINNIENKGQYQIVAVSSYYEDKKALGLIQKERSIYCDTDFTKCMEDADAIVFAENTMDYSYNGYIERIQQAKESGKTIYASASLLEKMGVNVENGNFRILQEKKLAENPKVETNAKEIDIPVISVMGMGKNCDKFNLQVKVKSTIEKQGYRVLSICSNVLGKFLGMEILPGFLFAENMSYPEKIKNFNLWLYTLVKQTKPDVLLMGCPGGMSGFEEYETNYYAEIPLVMSNAVSVDASLVTLYANMEQDADTAKRLSDFSSFKFETEVKNYIISKQYFKTDYEWRKIRYYKIDERNGLNASVNNISDYHILYIENDSEIEEQVKRILMQFQNNFHVI